MTLVRIRRHRSCRSAYSRRLLVALAIFTIISIAEILSVHYTLSKPAWEEPSDLVPLPRVFIVGIHWNNEKILREHWNHALIALTNKIGPENVFVSIYESGSWDDTKGALRSLDYALEELKIPRRIVLDETTHLDEISRPPSVNGWVHTPGGTPELRRIPYLAQLRNAAMQPLYDIQNITIIPFDKIIFLNDVVFDNTDILNLLSTRGGDYAAACSLDFSRPPAFYDTFALRDSEGHEAMMQEWPYFRSRESRQALKTGKPARVTSCWNGVAIMDAEPFYQNPRLIFRGVSDSLAELHVEGSECCLIHTDNPLSRKKGVWLNPNVRVGYNVRAYRDVNPGNRGSWMPLYTIARGLWLNRLKRWSSSPWPKELAIRRRVSQWKKERPSSHEVGIACLINEMQILAENGWAHV